MTQPLPFLSSLTEAPVYDAQLLLRVVDDNVVRLDVAVHDAVRVAVVEGLPPGEWAEGQGGGCKMRHSACEPPSLLPSPPSHDADLVHVEADVLVRERRVEHAEVDVLDVLEDEAGPACWEREGCTRRGMARLWDKCPQQGRRRLQPPCGDQLLLTSWSAGRARRRAA